MTMTTSSVDLFTKEEHAIIADWLLAREAAHYPHDFRDVDAMFVHRNQNVARYLPPLQRVIAK